MSKTKKALVALSAAAFATIGITGAFAEASVGADLASAYVFRGATVNDSVVLQPYAEVSGHDFTFGTWANLDLDNDDVDGENFNEIDLYVAYALPIDSEALSLSVGYTEYTYPHAGGEISADGLSVDPVDADREFGLVANLTHDLNPSLGVYYGVDGAIDSSWYAEASIGKEIELDGDMTASVGALVGYANPDVGDDGFSHVAIDAGLGLGMFSAGVTWYIETDDDVLEIDEEVVGTLSFSHGF